MQVIRAKSSGFCFGVDRAYKLAETASGERRAILGELIHNPQALERLAMQGIVTIEEVPEHFDGTLLLRAHGVSDKRRKNLESRVQKLIDGTCPYVTKAHVIAKKFVAEGRTLVIIGDRNHPEMQGIIEDLPQAICVNSVEEVQAISPLGRVGAICQTTARKGWVMDIAAILEQKSNDFCLENTICNATTERQEAALKLAQTVDCMVVIGGKNSNNTRKLAEICSEHCPTVQIETAAELDRSWFSSAKTVGVTAGASTPEWVIEEVIQEIQNAELKMKNEGRRK